jgi:hypothetical protein
MKKKRHKEIETDYEAIKSKHLERLADQILKNDEKMNQLKSKEIDPKFLNLF